MHVQCTVYLYSSYAYLPKLCIEHISLRISHNTYSDSMRADIVYYTLYGA